MFHEPDLNKCDAKQYSSYDQEIIVLSARSEQQLKIQVKQLYDTIQKQLFTDDDLRHICYTLQTGREHMELRFGVLVTSITDLQEKLHAYIEGYVDKYNFYLNLDNGNEEIFSILSKENEFKAMVDKLIRDKRFMRLLELWIKGIDFDWERLYESVEKKPHMLSLPPYPFAKEVYWLPDQIRANAGTKKTSPDIKSNQTLLYEELWIDEKIKYKENLKYHNLVIFLSCERNQKEIQQWMAEIDASMRIIFVKQGLEYQNESDTEYTIEYRNHSHYIECLQEIKNSYSSIDLILYMWPLEDEKQICDMRSILYLLQGLSITGLKPKSVILTGAYKNVIERCYMETFIGFERSVRQINNDTKVKLICKSRTEPEEFRSWKRVLENELGISDTKSVLYEKMNRKVCGIRQMERKTGRQLLKEGGTYLITGGLGGLGLIFAEFLAVKYKADLVLINRSKLEDKKSDLKRLEKIGANFLYIQADVCDLEQMQAAVSTAKNRFGKIDGVIHAAGVKGGSSLLKKDYEEFQKILEPKVQGTLVLESVFAKEPLDFICYFSSSAAVLGDYGSCAYSVGNRFLSCFGKYCDEGHSVTQLKRFVIEWPLWKDGGMQFEEEESRELYLKVSRQRLLDADEGTAIFEQLLQQDKTECFIVPGPPLKENHFFKIIAHSKVAEKPKLLEVLKDIVNQILGIPQEKIETDDNLADLGFDSISLSRFADLLSDRLNLHVTPDLFFSYPNLEKIRKYLYEQHAMPSDDAAKCDDIKIQVMDMAKEAEDMVQDQNPEKRNDADRDSIAIIGMSGRFPGARNIDEFWSILYEGKETVSIMPKDRFDIWEKCAEWKGAKIDQKKLGIVPGVTEFDPKFFNITPREAEQMDPRQRLLLEEAWKALEDAGYGEQAVGNERIAMFVGAEEGDYRFLPGDGGTVTSASNAVLAARLSYFMNLEGPSMAIDTACSSGLMAVHQACLSLRNGDCDTAIVAGVNLMLSPENYITMEKAGMLSLDGRCYAFDQRANGLVPAEAVAVIVLKKYAEAEAAGNPIYASIVGSGVNYDGKTNGITAPNGLAQTNLLKDVYKKYDISLGDISYIVTHGTGTKIGDPIEMNAMAELLKEYPDINSKCALTSVKPNIGHTLAASGIVSLINLTMSLNKEVIPKSIHCDQVNDYIHCDGSVFYFNRENQIWKDSEKRKRMGGVNAFGMSGTNVHVVLKSYGSENSCKKFLNQQSVVHPFYMLVFSAKSREALQERLKGMKIRLESDAEIDVGMLSSMSYTLITGRQHFNYRTAVVVSNREDAVKALNQAVQKEKASNLFYGEINKDFKQQKEIKLQITDFIEQVSSKTCGKSECREILCKLAEWYCLGYVDSYDQIWGADKPKLCRLPTYPFERGEYFKQPDDRYAAGGNNKYHALHPMVHENTSNLKSQRFSSKFTGKEDFLIDGM